MLLDDKHENILNPIASPFAVEQELLDITTKKELVLAASEELEVFANQLKQIKALEHVLESSNILGWLKEITDLTLCAFLLNQAFPNRHPTAVDDLAIKLQPLEAKHKLQSQALSQTSKSLSQLMENYNGIVSFCKRRCATE
jgi:Dynactin subunit p22